jgi:ubiquinone/menaquinone biosynthesis C-methylase UbiE
MARAGLWWQVLSAALCSRSNRQFYDRIAPFYDQVFVGHKTHADKMVEILTTSYADQESYTRVLDLGCGTGLLTHMLSDKGFDVTGLDISFKSLLQMRQSAPHIRTVHGDGQYLPFNDGSFQAVVSLGTWRHFSNVQRVITEVARILRNDGILVIGYFPPALGGAIHLGHGIWHKMLARLYQLMIGRLGYVDRADLLLEQQTVSLASGHFKEVRTVISGEYWHLIVARGPTARLSH